LTGHARNSGLEKAATGTPGLIDAHFGDDPGSTMKWPHVSDGAGYYVLPLPFLAAVGAGKVFGLDRSILNPIAFAADIFSESHLGSS
jgi:hypothetical protein